MNMDITTIEDLTLQIIFVNMEVGHECGQWLLDVLGLACDYSKYPNLERQKEWLTDYLSVIYSRPPTTGEIEELLQEVKMFTIASHIYWGLWGCVQAAYSDIDFDYMSYAVKRFDEMRRILTRVVGENPGTIY